MQKFWKSVKIKIWQSYREFKGGNFLRHSVVSHATFRLHHHKFATFSIRHSLTLPLQGSKLNIFFYKYSHHRLLTPIQSHWFDRLPGCLLDAQLIWNIFDLKHIWFGSQRASYAFAIAVLSVHMSHWLSTPKRFNISKYLVHHTILLFLEPNFAVQSSGIHPKRGTPVRSDHLTSTPR